MNARKYWAKGLPIGMSGWVLAAALLFFTVSVARAASAPTKVESLEELYEKAKREGGKLNLYLYLYALGPLGGERRGPARLCSGGRDSRAS